MNLIVPMEIVGQCSPWHTHPAPTHGLWEGTGKAVNGLRLHAATPQSLQPSAHTDTTLSPFAYTTSTHKYTLTSKHPPHTQREGETERGGSNTAPSGEGGHAFSQPAILPTRSLTPAPSALATHSSHSEREPSMLALASVTICQVVKWNLQQSLKM